MRVVACPPRFAPTPIIRVWAYFVHLTPTPHPRLGPLRMLGVVFTVQSGPKPHKRTEIEADFAHLRSFLPPSPQHCVWADFAHLPTLLLCKVGLNTFLASRLGPALHTWRACRPLRPCAASFLPLSLPASLLFRVWADFAHLPTHILCKVGPNGLDAWRHGRTTRGRIATGCISAGTLLGDSGGLGTG